MKRPPKNAHLRALRESAFLTQADLAQIIGVDASSISNWEQGRNQIRLKHIPELAKALNCSVDDIFRVVQEGNDADGTH